MAGTVQKGTTDDGWEGERAQGPDAAGLNSTGEYRHVKLASVTKKLVTNAGSSNMGRRKMLPCHSKVQDNSWKIMARKCRHCGASDIKPGLHWLAKSTFHEAAMDAQLLSQSYHILRPELAALG